MARSLDEIIQELNAGYDPSRALINQKLAELPAQADSQIASLEAKKGVAFNDISDYARERGVGFSGIPIAEQAKYVSTDFLPAVARVRSSQNDAKSTLIEALNSTNLDQRKYATSLYQQELDRDEQRRQFEAQQAAERAARAAAAAQTASLAGLYGGGGGGGAAGGGGGAQDESTIMKQSLKQYLDRQYAAVPNASRAQQDNWVRNWANQFGINPNTANDPNGIWAFYNSIYPYEKYNRAAPAPKAPVPVKQVAANAIKRVTPPPLAIFGTPVGARR